MLIVHEVAQELAMAESEVIQQGMRALLLRELGRIELEIARLRERYDALQPAELKQAIARGLITSHPAWEDYIYWQNCLETHKTLTNLLQKNEQPAPALPEPTHVS